MNIQKLIQTCLVFIALSSMAGIAQGETASADEHIARQKANNLGVGASVVRWEQGVRFYVEGLTFEEITGWYWNDKPLGSALQKAFNEGSALQYPTTTGFKVEWRYPPDHLGLGADGRLGVTADKLGQSMLGSSLSVVCPNTVTFGFPTLPIIQGDTSCIFEKAGCTGPGKAPTAIDYPASGTAVSLGTGTVVHVEATNPGDGGKGTHVIIRHLLPEPGCPSIYTSYTHLDSLDKSMFMNASVVKGQSIGMIGGTGKGEPHHFQPHLRFEVKTDVGGDKVAGALDEEGHLDPNLYIDKSFAIAMYVEVFRGARHSCGIKSDGKTECWGKNDGGQTVVPNMEFKQIAIGGKHTCGLTKDFKAVCWGWNAYGQTASPDGVFKQISAGGRHSCGVKIDGGLACWGNNSLGQSAHQKDKFKLVGAGSYHTCAIKENGTLLCFGEESSTAIRAPEGKYLAIASGRAHSCAIAEDNTLVCWGDDRKNQATPPEGHFKTLRSYADYNCATRLDGFEMCWGKKPELDMEFEEE